MTLINFTNCKKISELPMKYAHFSDSEVKSQAFPWKQGYRPFPLNFFQKFFHQWFSSMFLHVSGKVQRILNFWCILAQPIAKSFGPKICSGISFFYAWTGSDTTSAFLEHGKKKHWNVWIKFPRVSKTFAKLSTPSDLSDEDRKELEVFELQVYFRGGQEESIDERQGRI